MFGMANLRPEQTGLGLIVHAYKDEHRYSKHAPRIKVYPGKPHAGDPTTITIPTPSANAAVLGKLTIRGKELDQAKAFAQRNHLAILAYWYAPDYTEDDLGKDLR